MGELGEGEVVVPTFNMQQYEWTEDGVLFFFSFFLRCYVILRLAAVLLLTSVRWIFFSSPNPLPIFCPHFPLQLLLLFPQGHLPTLFQPLSPESATLTHRRRK